MALATGFLEDLLKNDQENCCLTLIVGSIIANNVSWNSVVFVSHWLNVTNIESILMLIPTKIESN